MLAQPSQTVETVFQTEFGDTPQGIFCSPGRVNIIGEHTDYNDGFVLPAAIQFYTAIAASKRDDNVIEAIAVDHNHSKVVFSLDALPRRNSNAPWSDYLVGVIREFIARGHDVGGLNLVVSGNVPQGAGLSSSASFEVAIASTIATLNKLSVSGKEAALIGQAAENNFVGCNCGIMDQLVSALGKKGHAMLLDCRSLDTQMFSIPDDLSLVIINSNVKRGLVDSEYNLRRQQCEEAAAFFNVKALRDLDIAQLEAGKSGLSIHAYKRARHIVTENARTQHAAKALADNDIRLLSELMGASHASMRDDFEITVPAIDQLVEIVKTEIGERGGVRMTGGGFGGCVIALVPTSMQENVIKVVEEKYQALTGIKESIYICRSSDGGFQARQLD